MVGWRAKGMKSIGETEGAEQSLFAFSAPVWKPAKADTNKQK